MSEDDRGDVGSSPRGRESSLSWAWETAKSLAGSRRLLYLIAVSIGIGVFTAVSMVFGPVGRQFVNSYFQIAQTAAVLFVLAERLLSNDDEEV